MKMTKLEKRFVNMPRHAARAVNIIERLLPFAEVEEKQNCLEVGCGAGAVSKYMAEKYNLNVTGTDVDPEQIQLARESIEETGSIRFLKADSTDLPFGEGEFDVVLSHMVMHHIANWQDALGEISRVLKPKGCFIYCDILCSRWLAKIANSFKHSYGVITLTDLNSCLKKNNFTPIHSSSRKPFIFCEYKAVYQKSVRDFPGDG